MFVKLFSIAFIIIISMPSFSFFVKKQTKKIQTIVIDPGHGGKDPGCNGASHKEKDVALAVALKLGKLIEENVKDVKVIYTRKTDVFVELEDRAKIANDNHADLFISIHCNAAGKPVMIKDNKTGKMRPKTFKNSRGKTVVVETTNPIPYGSETYVMGLKNEEGKMKVAQRENSAILLEDNYEKKYEGFDPNSEESYIIMSNYTSSYVIQSAGLALKIQEEYSKKAGRIDKGVHRQSIWVLWRTAMPSVLTELGYLTNPDEEAFLGSEKGQSYMASCLFRAFRKYKDEQEDNQKTYTDDIEQQEALKKEVYNTSKDTTTSEEEDNEFAKKEQEIKREKEIKDSLTIIAKQKAEKIEIQKKQAIINKRKADSLALLKKEQAEAEKLIEVLKNDYNRKITLADINYKKKQYDAAYPLYVEAKETAIKISKYISTNYVESRITKIDSIFLVQKNNAANTVPNSKNISINHNRDIKVVFKVQFASVDKEVNVSVKYPHVTDVSFYKMNNVIKYTSGNFKTFDEALKHQLELKELGYKDCFVAGFDNNGNRLDINEAKKLAE